MNKKLVIVTLLLSLAGTNIVPSQPAFGVEMTWPLSALLFILPATSELSTIKRNIQTNNLYYWNATAGDYQYQAQFPLSSGYFASSNSFALALQAGVNIQNFTSNNGPYSSTIFYFSDVIRTQVNWPLRYFDNQYGYNHHFIIPPGGAKPYSQAPSQYTVRGLADIPNGFGNLTDGLAFALIQSTQTGMPMMKQYGLQNAQSAPIDPNNLTTLFSDNTNTYYFAQTGVMIYLPLHMISPGDDFEKADPDYLNFGPAPGTPAYNTPIINDPTNGTILPWTYGYMPRNIPAQLTGQPEATTPGTVNQIDF